MTTNTWAFHSNMFFFQFDLLKSFSSPSNSASSLILSLS